MLVTPRSGSSTRPSPGCSPWTTKRRPCRRSPLRPARGARHRVARRRAPGVLRGARRHPTDHRPHARRSDRGVPHGCGRALRGDGLHDMQAGFTRPMFASSLVSEWIAVLARRARPAGGRRSAARRGLRLRRGLGRDLRGRGLTRTAIVQGFDLDDVSIAAAAPTRPSAASPTASRSRSRTSPTRPSRRRSTSCSRARSSTTG